jgi:hypothetical protein
MPTYQVAHINEQGVDLIIIPLDSSFGNQTQAHRSAEIAEFQSRARMAGLRGIVVPVWLDGQEMKFIAPPGLWPFFQGVQYQEILHWLNTEIVW